MNDINYIRQACRRAAHAITEELRPTQNALRQVAIACESRIAPHRPLMRVTVRDLKNLAQAPRPSTTPPVRERDLFDALIDPY